MNENAPMTFLEFVVRHYLGSPRGNSSNPAWPCPFCERHNPSLLINPPVEGKATKFRCVHCREWGDEHDLVTFLDDNYKRNGDQFAIVSTLRHVYNTQVISPKGRGADADNAAAKDPLGKRKGRGRGRDEREAREARWNVEATWADLTPEQRRETAADLTDTSDLACYCRAFDEFVRASDRHHLSTCEDPECGAIVCRRRRGWTEEEIRKGIETILREALATRRERKEREAREEEESKARVRRAFERGRIRAERRRGR